MHKIGQNKKIHLHNFMEFVMIKVMENIVYKFFINVLVAFKMNYKQHMYTIKFKN